MKCKKQIHPKEPILKKNGWNAKKSKNEHLEFKQDSNKWKGIYNHVEEKQRFGIINPWITLKVSSGSN